MTIPENPFEPLSDYVLVENRLRREVSIFMPDGSKPESVFGFYVVKKGPGRVRDDGTLIPVHDGIQIGDEVILNNSAALGFTHPRTGTGESARKFVVVRPADILLVVSPEKPMDETTKHLVFGAHQ